MIGASGPIYYPNHPYRSTYQVIFVNNWYAVAGVILCLVLLAWWGLTRG